MKTKIDYGYTISMFLFILYILFMCVLDTIEAYSAEVTNYTAYASTSTVFRVPMKKTLHAMGMSDGTLYDPSPDQRLTRGITSATMTEMAKYSECIIDGAYEGMTNALTDFYSVTNNIEKWTNKVSICADMFPSAERTNIEAYITGLTTSKNGETNIFYVHFNSTPLGKPKIKLSYAISTNESYEADVNIIGWPVAELKEGYDGYKSYCVIPQAARGILLRMNPFLTFGSYSTPFQFSDAGFQFVDGNLTNTTYTGWTTNWTPEGIVYKRWKSGCYFSSTTNAEEVL